MPQGCSFRQCPGCKAYNTIHVLRCYKCATEFPRVTINRAESSLRTTVPAGDTRQAERSPLGVVGAILEVNGEVRHDVLIENISAGGLLFHSDVDYLPYDRFSMLIPLHGAVFVAEVSVRRCQSVRFTLWRNAIGAEFVEPEEELIRRIRELCRTGGRAGTFSFV